MRRIGRAGVMFFGLVLLALGVLLATEGALYAEQYPRGPVVLLVPYAPGGSADIVARVIAAKMEEHLGKPVVVENRAGASGRIATEALVLARPDGQTIGILSNALAINQAMKPPPNYDASKDVVPICRAIEIPFAILVNSSVPAQSLQQLIAYAKSHPGKLSFGHLGPGSPHFLVMKWFEHVTGIKMVAVPFRGAAPAYQALVGGQIQVIASGLGAATPFIRSRQVRPLAALSSKRPASLPDLPTVKELGLGDFKLTSWMGLFAPKGTPPEIVAMLDRQCAAAVNSPEIKHRLLQLGLEPAFLNAGAFNSFLQNEFINWGTVVRSSAK